MAHAPLTYLGVLACALFVVVSARADQAPSTQPNVVTLHLTLRFEELAEAPAKDKTKATITLYAPDKKLKEDPAALVEGDNDVELSLPDGQHYLSLRCPGYSPQHVFLTIKDGELTKDALSVTMYHVRYVTIRYALNTKGKRELTGDGVETGRVALTQWTAPSKFKEDWQLWQSERAGDSTFGAMPVLDFHRNSPRNGFASAPDNTKFDDLTEAPDPAETRYECKSREATAGLILFCRVAGNSGNVGFGKIEVEEVTLTPPKDIKVLMSK